jgi:hypothetical protein
MISAAGHVASDSFSNSLIRSESGAPVPAVSGSGLISRHTAISSLENAINWDLALINSCSFCNIPTMSRKPPPASRSLMVTLLPMAPLSGDADPWPVSVMSIL